MLIIGVVMVYLLIATLSYVATKAICKARIEKRNKAFANLPREVLLQHALLNPVYSSQYHYMLTTMDENEATEIIIRRMLFDNGLIGYRKEGS